LLSFVSALPAICQSKNQHRLLASVGQQSSPQSPQQRRHEQDEQLSTIQKENARRANEQRQLELKRDTDRLLQLTNELKQYVDKTNENILSLEVIKKAEEIERLAKSVKEKMKGHY
jgi:methionyl-tRNA synthetase